MTRKRKSKAKTQEGTDLRSVPKRKPRKEGTGLSSVLGSRAADGGDALGALRGKIDSVDEQIQRLIAQRAELAKEVGVLKGLTQTVDYYRPEREAQVLRKVVDRN